MRQRSVETVFCEECGSPSPSGWYKCDECDPVDEAALEEWEDRQRQRIAERNEY